MFSSKKMMLAIFAAIIMAVSAVWYVASPSSAATDKVYVCKYVGTPGEDERLKDGKQPIEVAVSSIQNNQWDGTVPGYFSDAHDRSYVLGYVGEIPEPSASDCPGGDTPEDKEIEVPEVNWNDPCGPDNATWNVPADDEVFNWDLENGHLTVTIIPDGFVFYDGTSTTPTMNDYGVAQDFNEPCEPEVISVPTATSSDLCDPGNAKWNVPNSDDTFDWSLLDNGHLIVTIQQEGSVFPGGDFSHDFGVVQETNTAPCGEIGSAGSVPASSTCGKIKIGSPMYSPADATVVVELNGKSVKPNDTYPVKAGSYTVELLLNGDSVFAQNVEVKKCGGKTGGSDLNNPAYAETGH